MAPSISEGRDVDDEVLGSHELNRAGTKPVIFPFLGIPWKDLIIYGFFAYQCWAFRWQLIIPLGAFMAFMVTLYKRDHYAGRRLMCWLLTSARCLTGGYSGGTSVQVEPAYRAFRGVIRCP